MATSSQSGSRNVLSALDTIYARQSVRAYAPDALDERTIRALLSAAVQAPTAMHAEPWAFVVIQNRATLTRYSDLAKAAFAHEAAAHADLHRPGEAARGSAFARRLASPDFCIFYDAGTLILICARPMGPFAVADSWLAAENLMLAACAMGLGTCCIGLALTVFNSPEVKAELGIPADVTPVAPIIVGVPGERADAVPRKDPAILSWVR